jgi:hypothetical protein
MDVCYKVRSIDEAQLSEFGKDKRAHGTDADIRLGENTEAVDLPLRLPLNWQTQGSSCEK